MATVSTLQDKLEERAKQKFLKSLEDLKYALERSPIDRSKVGEITIQYRDKNNKGAKSNEEFYYVLAYDKDFRSHLWDLHKEDLIQREVENFLRDVDSMQREIDDLKSGVLRNDDY